VKQKLDPKMLLDQVLATARNYLIESVVKKVALRILALFNPVGAIAQAVEAIYRVLKWVFKNAARLFRTGARTDSSSNRTAPYAEARLGRHVADLIG
jgi:hypothetical protein